MVLFSVHLQAKELMRCGVTKGQKTRGRNKRPKNPKPYFRSWVRYAVTNSASSLIFLFWWCLKKERKKQVSGKLKGGGGGHFNWSAFLYVINYPHPIALRINSCCGVGVCVTTKFKGWILPSALSNCMWVIACHTQKIVEYSKQHTHLYFHMKAPVSFLDYLLFGVGSVAGQGHEAFFWIPAQLFLNFCYSRPFDSFAVFSFFPSFFLFFSTPPPPASVIACC